MDDEAGLTHPRGHCFSDPPLVMDTHTIPTVQLTPLPRAPIACPGPSTSLGALHFNVGRLLTTQALFNMPEEGLSYIELMFGAGGFNRCIWYAGKQESCYRCSWSVCNGSVFDGPCMVLIDGLGA